MEHLEQKTKIIYSSHYLKISKYLFLSNGCVKVMVRVYVNGRKVSGEEKKKALKRVSYTGSDSSDSKVYATPEAAKVLQDINHPDAKKVIVSKGKHNISYEAPPTKQVYATPEAATVLKDINHPDAKTVKVSYGKHKIGTEYTPEQYAKYRTYGERSYEMNRKPKPTTQTIKPTNVYTSGSTHYGLKSKDSPYYPETKRDIKAQQERIKQERGYAETYDQAKKTTPKSHVNPYDRYDYSTRTLKPYESPPKTTRWEKANLWVRKNLKTDKVYDTLFDSEYRRSDYKQNVSKEYLEEQKLIKDSVRYARENPLATAAAAVVAYGYTKAGRGVRTIAKSKYVRPIVSKSKKLFWSAGYMPKLTKTKTFQVVAKNFRVNQVGSKAAFTGFYIIPKTVQYGKATTSEQRREVLASVPSELVGFKVGGKLAQKTPVKDAINIGKTKYTQYKNDKIFYGNEKGGTWKPTYSDNVFISRSGYQKVTPVKTGFEPVPKRRILADQKATGKSNPYYTVVRERQLSLGKPSYSSYEPMNEILGSGYVPKWHIKQGKLYGKQTTLDQANPLGKRTLRLMQVKGMREESMKVQSRPFYQRQITEYHDPNPLENVMPKPKSKYTPIKKPFYSKLMDKFAFAEGTRGQFSVTRGATMTRTDTGHTPQTNIKQPKFKSIGRSKSKLKLVTKSKTKVGGFFYDFYDKKEKVFLNNPPNVNINPNINKMGLETPQKIGFYVGQKQSVKLATGLKTDLTTSQITSIYNPNPTIDIEFDGGYDSTPRPPTPKNPPNIIIGGGFLDWPSASYTFGSKAKRKIGKQRKGYTPSAFASGFGIKGKPTKFGIKSGLGLRPIKL